MLNKTKQISSKAVKLTETTQNCGSSIGRKWGCLARCTEFQLLQGKKKTLEKEKERFMALTYEFLKKKTLQGDDC